MNYRKFKEYTKVMVLVIGLVCFGIASTPPAISQINKLHIWVSKAAYKLNVQ